MLTKTFQPPDHRAIHQGMSGDLAGLARDPVLWGRVQLHVETDSSGAVRSVRERESHFPDSAVTQCLARAVRDVAFPSRKNRPKSFEVGVRLGTLRDGLGAASD